ncbi:MAG: hypothetical protein J0L53_14760 [Spirochaetes bacterium]|nr:hypothetical protein [Spirochaetota bacterium]MBX3721937.1 hypothetical protein [Turneriella sp.]
MNPVLLRNRAIRKTRSFFSARGLHEVMTPKAVPSPALEPYIDAVGLTAAQSEEKRFLATSPEFALKKIFRAEMTADNAARGIYEISSVFRDDRPGKHHALEFTMVEWYEKESHLNAILANAGALIAYLSTELGGTAIAPGVKIIDLRSRFEETGCAFAFDNETGAVEKYTALHGNLPQHLNSTDAAIACFNLLFDEFILPGLRDETGLVAVSGYPDYLGALAFTANGIAERGEIYYGGLEIANGYREEFRPAVARERWLKYNEIRRLRGVDPHMIDEKLLAELPYMENVAGIAVGLERVLMAIFPGLKLPVFFN